MGENGVGVALVEAGGIVRSGDRAAPSCLRPGDDVLARSPQSVVVLGRDVGVYGCLRSVGTRVTIVDPEGDDTTVQRVRLAGEWAATTAEEICPACSDVFVAVTVTNLRTARQYQVAGYTNSSP